jgi:hypothetical protein
MAIAIAMIPLAKGARLSTSKTLADLKVTWSIEPPDAKKGDGSWSFGFGEYFAAVAMMPAPIPEADLRGPIETATLWPDAGKDLKTSPGHLIVTVMTAEDGGAVELRRNLTRVVASVLEGCEGALGVYWGDATMLIRKDVFREIAVEALPEPPLLLWVDFRVGPVAGGKSGGFTVGMSALGLMELESDAANEPPAEFRDRLMSIAAYLLANGLVIKDGDTVGESPTEKIRASYGKSSFGHEEAVIRLQFEAPAKKSFWKRS